MRKERRNDQDLLMLGTHGARNVIIKSLFSMEHSFSISFCLWKNKMAHSLSQFIAFSCLCQDGVIGYMIFHWADYHQYELGMSTRELMKLWTLPWRGIFALSLDWILAAVVELKHSSLSGGFFCCLFVEIKGLLWVIMMST